MFLLSDILGDEMSISRAKFNADLSSFSIKNGLFNEVYLSSNVNDYKSLDYTWDSDVIVLATFDSQTLEGGNIGDLGNRLQSMQLRRREIGKSTWTILAAYPIPDTAHLNFSFADYFARGRETKYEYSVTYILKDGTELPYISAAVVSEFYGAIISDGVTTYHVYLDPSITSITRNRQANVVTTLNNKYPYIFFGSNSNYDSGSFSGTIIKKNEDEEDSQDFDASYRYREDMIDWLTNGEPKILKMEDGREWLMSVNGNVDVDNSEHVDKVNISFDFVQIGDYDNSDDLSNNGLSAYNDMEFSTYYSIITNLISTSSSSHLLSVKQGEKYYTKITAYEGYTLTSVSVVMNGVSITDSVYNKETGEITIDKVTNDVSISATSVKIKIDKLALDYSKLLISKNSKKKISLVYSPSDAKITDITWRSSDPDVVVVVNGMIQGMKAGDAIITASVDGIEASCSVNVSSLAEIEGVPISTFREGAAIHMRENSSPVYYIVAKHNYQTDLNGEGRTLIIRKAEYAQTKWNASDVNTYENSTIDKLLVGTFKDSLDSKIAKYLSDYPTKIYYTKGNGRNSVTTLSRAVFLLSAAEYGPTSSGHNVEGEMVPVAKQILSDGCSGNKAMWTRTPATNSKTSAAHVYFNSTDNTFESKLVKCTSMTDPDTGAKLMIHPAMTLADTMKITIDNPIKASSITLNKYSIVIHIGEEFKLNVSYLPLDATYPLTNYGSSNPFVATVNDGTITGVSVGNTTITVSVDNISATCEVRVVE